MRRIGLVIQRRPERSQVTGEGEAPASAEAMSDSPGDSVPPSSSTVLPRPGPHPWESLSCLEIKATFVSRGFLTAAVAFISKGLAILIYLASSVNVWSWLCDNHQQNLTTRARVGDFSYLCRSVIYLARSEWKYETRRRWFGCSALRAKGFKLFRWNAVEATK